MDDTRFSDQARGDSPPAAPTARPNRGRGITFQLAAVALTIVSALAGTGLARWLKAPEDGTPKAPPGPVVKFPGQLFKDWKDPDLVLVLTGQQNGYLLPCGCSKPQVGGLERRYNFLQMIKANGWSHVAVDVGDMVQRHAPARLPNQQALIKYVYSMKALKEMGYTAVTIGEHEANIGLGTVLAEYALNESSPRVVVNNLLDADKQYPFQTLSWEQVEPVKTGIKVGVTGVVGPTVAARIKSLDKSIKFERTPDAVNRVLADMASRKVNLGILLYQGPPSRNAGKKPYTEAMACAEAYPQFPVIVSLSEEDEPPSRPVELTTSSGSKSLVVSLGKKGKFVGVVGVWKTGKASAPFEFRYERAEMSEDYLTPKDKEKGHPIVDLMEAYTRDLKDRDYLSKYGQVRHELQTMDKVKDLARDVEVRYAGSQVCKRCHPDAYDVWKKSPHSHAYKTLVDAERPGNRQYDPECIVCHTVGFGYLSGFVNETKTPNLKDVGCESCHGPSYAHVQNPNNLEWQKRINPWRHLPVAKREGAIDQMCQHCHDIDNDVTWINKGFQRKWPRIAHPTPKQPGDEK